MAGCTFNPPIYTHDDLKYICCFSLQLKTVINFNIIKRGATTNKVRVFAFAKNFLSDFFFNDYKVLKNYAIQCSCNFKHNQGIQGLQIFYNDINSTVQQLLSKCM